MERSGASNVRLDGALVDNADRKLITEAVREMRLSIPRLDALRAGIDLYGATSFSTFSIFSPNENTLSRVIVELFDPRGSHGQGLLFLNALLEAIGHPRVNTRESVRVRREVLTRAGRRIDIVIDTPRLVLGIENKPWAVQQPNQLQDYISELSSDLRGRTPILVFLSDQDEKSAEGKSVRVPYFAGGDEVSLHSILVEVVDNIKADRPRAFVREFIAYIGTVFGDEHPMEDADKPYIDAVSAEFDDPHNRKALATFLLAQSTLHWQILDEVGLYLLEQVQEFVAGDFIVTQAEWKLPDFLEEQYEPWGVRRPNWPKNCEVALESQKAYFENVKFGVKAPDGRRLTGDQAQYGSSARPALDGLSKQISGGRKTVYWPWEQELWESYWGPEFAARLVIQSPTGLVADHPEVQELGRRFVEMAKAVDDALTQP